MNDLLIIRDYLKGINHEFEVLDFPNKMEKCIYHEEKEEKIVIKFKHKKDKDEFGLCLPSYITEIGKLWKEDDGTNKRVLKIMKKEIDEVKNNYGLSSYSSFLYNYYFNSNI